MALPAAAATAPGVVGREPCVAGHHVPEDGGRGTLPEAQWSARTEPMDIAHILVTTDLSPEALRPCRPVVDLARSVGARVTLLHVVQDFKVPPHGAPLMPPASPADVHAELAGARKALAKQRASLPADVRIDAETIVGDAIPRAIADFAHDNAVDLIALSTHGRTGFRHLVLGSVAEAVLRHAHVPVLCFPRQPEATGEGPSA